MKILITGSNGLLGQKLAALLLQQPNVDVLATSRGANKLAGPHPALRFVALDVTDAAQVQALLAHERPTHLVHTAAMTNVDECELNQDDCWEQNVTAVQHLVAACAEHNIHLTHLSTDFIFSGKAGPLTEEAVPAPVNFYGVSKLAAEQLVQASTGPWAIARTVLVYGVAHRYGRTNLVLWVRDALRAGKPIKVVDDQWRTPTLVEVFCGVVQRVDLFLPVAHPHVGRRPGAGLLAAGPAIGAGHLPSQLRRVADALCHGFASSRVFRAG